MIRGPIPEVRTAWELGASDEKEQKKDRYDRERQSEKVLLND